LCFVVVAASCGGGGGEGIAPETDAVLSVTVTPKTPTPIDPTDVVQLTENVTVQGNPTKAVNWESSSNQIATVTSTGLVTGVAQGTATIKATSQFNPNRSDQATITVNAAKVVAVSLNATDRGLPFNQTFVLTANVDTKGILPKTVTFSSSPQAIVTITSNDNINATITGVRAGATTVTATSTADPTKSKSIVVTVMGTVDITQPPPIDILKGTTFKLTPTVREDPGVSRELRYESADPLIATVANDGTVSGVALGNTTVTVTSVGDPTKKVTVPVKVRSGVRSVTLTPRRDSVRPTLTRQLTPQADVEPGITTGFTYQSADVTTVTVDANGLATGVKIGQAYVRALASIDPGAKDSVLMVVVDPCVAYPTLTLGTKFSGTISLASCAQSQEKFKYNIATTGQYRLSARFDFTALFVYFMNGIQFWYGNYAGQIDFPMVLTPSEYDLIVDIGGTVPPPNQRGFDVTVATGFPATTSCYYLVTTNVTVPSALVTSCVTGSRPGTYYARRFRLLPFLQAGQTLTITVNGTGFTPYFEIRGNNDVVLRAVTGTGTAATTTYSPATGQAIAIDVSSMNTAQVGNFSITISGPAIGAFNSAPIRSSIDRTNLLGGGSHSWPDAARPAEIVKTPSAAQHR
jgi:uncharacterized protein YjdB